MSDLFFALRAAPLLVTVAAALFFLPVWILAVLLIAGFCLFVTMELNP